MIDGRGNCFEVMKNKSVCEWDDLPSLSQVITAFVPICLDMMQLNYRTCTDVLPWYQKIKLVDSLIVCVATTILTIIKPVVMDITLNVLTRYCNNSSKDLRRASEILYECGTRILIVGWTFYDVVLAPECSYIVAPMQVLRGVWEAGASGANTTLSRRLLLLVSISRYSSALIDVLFLAERRRDTISLVIHHVVAVLMMTTAYTTFPELGLTVFFLHEACDPSLEVARLLHYLQSSKGSHTVPRMSSHVCFVVFTIKWFLFRLYLFPMRGMYPATAVDRNSCQYGSYAAAALLAALLFMLNIAWSVMIIRAIINRFLYSRLTDETMESPHEFDQQNSSQKNLKSKDT